MGQLTIQKSRKKREPKPFRPLIFISYSHQDKEACEKLEKHMAQLKREGVELWFDEAILPGADLDASILRHLKKAHIFVALGSPAYLDSPYCFDKEYGFALRKAGRKKLHVIVALIHNCQWKHTRMTRYKLLPTDGKPVDQWKPHGDAYEDIVNGIRQVVTAVRAEQLQPVKRGKPKAGGRTKKVGSNAKPKRGGSGEKLAKSYRATGSASKTSRPTRRKPKPTRAPSKHRPK